MTDGSSHDTAALAARLDELTEELGARPQAPRRRGPAAAAAGPDTVTMRLVERDGVLVVDDSSAPTPSATRRRGPGADAPPRAVWQRELATLERSQITGWLQSLDRKLTPNQGLRRWHDGALRPVSGPPSDEGGKVLLIVHGTFSNTENILDGIARNPDGRDFFDWMTRQYTQVFTLDHPTLSVSPMLNARALALHLRGTKAPVDVVSHSRGGLITRWWLEAFDSAPADRRRAVFVGAPLAGTGLAAPPNLKSSLSLLSNVAKVLGVAGAGLPFLTVLTGVFRVVSSVTTLAAKTPAIDAAVALVPGLFALSRVGNALEIQSLRGAAVDWRQRYFAVRSNFQSEQPGWRFWRYFRKVGDRLKDLGADVVFDGDNDLVVDSQSMVELSDTVTLEDAQVYDFTTTDRVYHTNYFEQPETLAFIRRVLG